MELLSQDETRDFNSFLNSFGSNEMEMNNGLDYRTREGNWSNSNQNYQSGGNSSGSTSCDYASVHAPTQPSPYSTPFVYTTSPQLSYFPQTQANGNNGRTYPFNPAPYQTYSPVATPHSHFYPAQPSPPLPDVTLLPYQTHQTAEELQIEKQERMRVQTLELGKWMKARGVSDPSTMHLNGAIQNTRIAHANGLTGIPRTREENDNYSQEFPRDRNREEMEPLGVRAIKRVRTLSHCSGEEREDSLEADETMGSLREAELRAGFNDRVEIQSAAPPPKQRAPIIPPSPKRITKPLKKASPIASTSKTPKAKPKPKARVVPPPLPESDPTTNPPPMITPSNIPPAAFTNRPAVPPSRRSTITSIPIASTSNSNSSAKPALLSVAQKKANHIASEQKRRAAIRAGYEQLCFTVPSLKAAVEEFEERAKKVGKGKKSDKGALMGGIEIGGEKVDGRAGPRSEAVVLGKSVDHLRALLTTRVELMERLSNGYARGEEMGKIIPAGARDWDLHWIEGEMEEEE